MNAGFYPMTQLAIFKITHTRDEWQVVEMLKGLAL